MSSRKKSRVADPSSASESSDSSEELTSSASSSDHESDSSARRSKKRSRTSKSTKSTKSTKKSASKRKSTSSRSKSRMSTSVSLLEATGFDALLQLASASTALDEGRAVAESLPSIPVRKDKSTKSRDTAAKSERSNDKKRKPSKKSRTERENENESSTATQPSATPRPPATSPEQPFNTAATSVHPSMLMMQNVQPQITAFPNQQYIQTINELGQVTFINPNTNEAMMGMSGSPFITANGQTPQYGIQILPNGQQQITLLGLNHMGQFTHAPQQMIQRHFMQSQFTQQPALQQLHDSNIKQSNHITDLTNQIGIGLYQGGMTDRNNVIGPLLTVGAVPQQPKGPLSVDRKLCSRHVAIAYQIFRNQRASTANADRAVQDPTLEARRLKERTEWARRGIQPVQTPSVTPSIATAAVPALLPANLNGTVSNPEIMLQQQQQQQLAAQLQLVNNNPSLMQHLLQSQLAEQQQQQQQQQQNMQRLSINTSAVPVPVASTAITQPVAGLVNPAAAITPDVAKPEQTTNIPFTQSVPIDSQNQSTPLSLPTVKTLPAALAADALVVQPLESVASA